MNTENRIDDARPCTYTAGESHVEVNGERCLVLALFPITSSDDDTNNVKYYVGAALRPYSSEAWLFTTDTSLAFPRVDAITAVASAVAFSGWGEITPHLGGLVGYEVTERPHS